MGQPWVGRSRALLPPPAPAVKEHDRDVDPASPGIDHSLPQPSQVGRVDLIEIKLRVPVRSCPRPRPHVKRRREPVAQSRLGTPARLLPYPQPREVVIVALQKIEIR